MFHTFFDGLVAARLDDLSLMEREMRRTRKIIYVVLGLSRVGGCPFSLGGKGVVGVGGMCFKRCGKTMEKRDLGETFGKMTKGRRPKFCFCCENTEKKRLQIGYKDAKIRV